MTEDRARPDDGDVEPVGDGCEAGPLGGELGVAVRLDGRGHGRAAGPGSLAGTPNTALDDVCTTLPTPAPRRLAAAGAVPSTLTVRSRCCVPGQRHLGDVVEHDVDAGRRRARRRCAIADVADARTRRRLGASSASLRSSTRTSWPAATRRCTSSEPKYPLPPVTRLACVTARCPCSTHQRMLRRMPSYERDRRVVAELARARGDVAGDGLVHLAEHVELLLVAATAPARGGRPARRRGRRSRAGGVDGGFDVEALVRRAPGRRWRRSR